MPFERQMRQGSKARLAWLSIEKASKKEGLRSRSKVKRFGGRNDQCPNIFEHPFGGANNCKPSIIRTKNPSQNEIGAHLNQLFLTLRMFSNVLIFSKLNERLPWSSARRHPAVSSLHLATSFSSENSAPRKVSHLGNQERLSTKVRAIQKIDRQMKTTRIKIKLDCDLLFGR